MDHQNASNADADGSTTPRGDAPEAVRDSVSLNTLLLRLVFLCALPWLLVAGYLAISHVIERHQDNREQADLTARNFAASLDRTLAWRLSELQLLAASPLLDEPRTVADFYQEATRFRSTHGGEFVLADASYQMLLNTRVAFGTPLPPLPRPRSIAAAAALESSKPVIGNVVNGPIANRRLVDIAAPVIRGGKPRLILLHIIEAEEIQQHLEQVALPAQWALSVYDGSGAVLARRAPPDIIIDPADAASTERWTIPSGVSRWSVSLDIPVILDWRRITQAAIAVFALIVLATLASLIVGALTARRLSRDVARLPQSALMPTAFEPAIAEIRDVHRKLNQQAAARAAAETSLQASEQRLAFALQSRHIGAWELDLQNHTVTRTLIHDRLFGYDTLQPDWTQARLLEHVLPEDRAQVERSFTEALRARSAWDRECRIRRADGAVRWIRIAGDWASGSLGKPSRMCGVVEDITERKHVDAEHQQLAAIVATSDDAIVCRAPDDTIISWNAAAERMFGWSTGEAIGQSFRGLLSQTPDRQRQRRFEKVLRGEDVAASNDNIDVRQRRDGSRIHVQSTLSAVKDTGGKIVFVSCIMRDVTERVKSEQHIEQLANRDLLTGLFNRSMLMQQMNAAISRAARAQNQLVVMFIDLDRFKAVNDTLGHASGDDLLCECARRLTECVRVVDIVARLGGDEFVILLTDVHDSDIVVPIADRMLESVAAPYALQGRDVQVSASIGICFYPADGRTVATLMKNADIAMYHAKERGRNNYQFYKEPMNQCIMQRLQLERELRLALDNQEFVLYYQPQIDVASGQLRGAESLLRWKHPSRGLLLPVDFLPAAEAAGLIKRVGLWALDHACGTIKSWHEQGVNVPYIVVNISTSQLDDGFVGSLREVLLRHGIAPGSLMLEITETVQMEDVEQAIALLQRIRELGIRIALDDFGTGYSSLSVLQRLPIDALKIDRSFISAIDHASDGGRAVAIIGAILAIARVLNLSVVAEGVETSTQLEFLRNLNCDLYQGYLYSMPVDTITMAAVATPKWPDPS